MKDAEQPLFVPVRRSNLGTLTPMTARLPQGPRAGIAFTSAEALQAATQPGQDWIRLAQPALRALLRPLGIERIQIDAALIAADVSQPTPAKNVPVAA